MKASISPMPRGSVNRSERVNKKTQKKTPQMRKKKIN
jgi:hypothetical protein